MPIDPAHRCPCHDEPMYRHRITGWYACIIKRRARVARYQATESGRAARRRGMQHFSRRRVRIGRRYLFVSPTVTEANALNAHIKERVIELVTRQSRRAEVEGY
jgi:hypothetical protein